MTSSREDRRVEHHFLASFLGFTGTFEGSCRASYIESSEESEGNGRQVDDGGNDASAGEHILELTERAHQEHGSGE